MTSRQLCATLETIGWSQRALARRLGLEDTMVWRWASGRYPVPQDVAAWLTKLAALVKQHPAPGGVS